MRMDRNLIARNRHIIAQSFQREAIRNLSSAKLLCRFPAKTYRRLLFVLLGSAVAFPAFGADLPTGGEVVSGAATFSQSTPNRLDIAQSSNRAIINFSGFNIAAGNEVVVVQPTAQSMLLARVLGSEASTIAGSLTANGHLVLINPNGIAIRDGAVIDTGAFIASSLDIADADFLSGQLLFRRSGRAAAVSNAGTIRARAGIALVGPAVLNEGVVAARLGKVGFASGDLVTVDFSSDGFLSVALPASDVAGMTDALGQPLQALITAGGTVRADGGRILLTAATARDLILSAVRVTGDLIATTVRAGSDGNVHFGAIDIDGRDGVVQLTGHLDATGGVGLDGGRIVIDGGFVATGGVIDASGGLSGGSIDVRATRELSLADTVRAAGINGSGGDIQLTSGGSISESVGSFTDASGGYNGGTIGVSAASDLASSGNYAASGLLGLGGRIDITGDSIRLLSTQLTARGGASGGLVRIGGAFQGGNPERLNNPLYQNMEGRFGTLPTLAAATSAFVNDGVKIDISSARGVGGAAIVWSEKLTTMLGAVTARGPRGGGAVEISGKETLRSVDLPRIDVGVGGDLLLDPRDIVIGDVGTVQSWLYAGIVGVGYSPDLLGAQAGVAGNSQFGRAVSLNATGDRLAVGEPLSGELSPVGSLSGRVRLFTFTDSNFSGGVLAATIGAGFIGGKNFNVSTNTDKAFAFGTSVSLNAAGNRLAVGAAIDRGFGNVATASGAVSLITFTDTAFSGGALAATIGRGYTGGNNIDLGTALAGDDRLGTSVALNAAGDRLAAGAVGDDGPSDATSNTGSVRLFTFADTNFTGGALVTTIGRGYTGGSNLDLGSELEASDAFGTSVALNAAGDRLAVGAPLDSGSGNSTLNSGSVRLFSFSDTSFAGGTLTATIGRDYSGGSNLDLGSALEASDSFGRSVALNAAGDRLAVGALGDDGATNASSNSGSVRLFTFTDTGFAGGALAATLGAGYTGGNNMDLGTILEANDQFGSSVALNAAGNRLAVGAHGDDGLGNIVSLSGAVRLFTFTNTLFAGGALAATIGAGYIDGNDILFAERPDANDQFGVSVSLNAVGDRLAVGGFGDDGASNLVTDSGAVRLFTFSNASFGGGALAATIGRGYTGGNNIDLTALDANDQFGYSVALNAAGDRLAVGSIGDDGPANASTDSGSAYLFSFTNSSFAGGALQAVLGKGYTGGKNIDVTAIDASDNFGRSVSLNAPGDRLAVGSEGDDGPANATPNSGAAILFGFTDTGFSGGTVRAIVGKGYTGGSNVDVAALGGGDLFGTSVSLNAAGDRLAVGARADDGPANATSNSGAAYLFSFSDSSFASGMLQATLGKGYTGGNNLDFAALEANDQFGISVSLNAAGDRLAVGARADAGPANATAASGAAYLIGFTNNSFAGGALQALLGKGYVGGNNLDLAALEAGDNFGISVSLNAAGNRLAVGAHLDDGLGNSISGAGAVRLFSFTDTSFAGGSLAGTIGDGYVDTNNVDVGDRPDASDSLGQAVALNAAGVRLAVGAPGDDGAANLVTDSGAVRLFTFTNTSFGGGALAATIGRGFAGGNNIDLGAGLEASDNFGSAVALNATGDRLAVGASGDDGMTNTASGSGAVRLFSFANTSFGGGTLAATIGVGYSGGRSFDLGSSLATGDSFGGSVALNAAGTLLAAGANFDDGAGNSLSDSGAVYLFRFTDSAFSGIQLSGTIGNGYTGGGNLDLSASLGNVDQLGRSVSLNASGDRLAIGAGGDDGFGEAANNSGSVRLLSFSDTSFGGGAVIATIGHGYTGGKNLDLSGVLEAADQFGRGVALNAAGDRLAVGAFQDDGFNNVASNSGAVRYFTFTDNVFSGGVLATTIGKGYVGAGDVDIADLEATDNFGASVSVNATGTLSAAGAPGDDGIGNGLSSAGAVYLFTSPAPSVGSLAFATTAASTSLVSLRGLSAALSAGTSITLQASNDITLASALTVDNPAGNGGALTLTAGRSILLNGSIVTDNGNLTLTANTGGGDLTTVNANRQAGAAVISMAGGTSINAGSGAVNVALAAGTGLTTPTSDDITLGSIMAGSLLVSNAGPTAGSDIIVRNGAVLAASGSGRAIDLRAEAGTFTNNAGAGLFSLTGGGSYAVFSDSPANTTEGVTGYLKRYNVADVAAFAALSPGSSFFGYRIAPVLTVTPNAAARVYGDANPALSIASIGGFIDGDTATGSLTGAATVTTAATAATNVGTSAITTAIGTLASVEGYGLAFSSANLTITAKSLTASLIGTSSKQYNQTTAATLASGNYNVSGFVLAEGATVTQTVGTYDSKNVGTGKTVTTTLVIGDFTANSGTLLSNYTLPTMAAGAIGSITVAPLSVNGLTGVNRVYDGTTTAGLTGTAALTGLFSGDDVTLGGSGSATFANKNVGTGKTITITGFSASTGVDAGNYLFTQPTGLTGNVTAKLLTVNAVTDAKTYDRTTVSIATVSAVGLVGGDTTSTLSQTFDTRNAGTGKTLTVGSFTISDGNGGNNYNVLTNTALGTINAKALTVTGVSAQNKVYDGATTATLLGGSLSGIVTGDTVIFTAGTGTFADKNTGTAKSVTASGYGITGTDAGNYVIGSQPTGLSANVTPKSLTASLIGTSSKQYNQTTAATLASGNYGLTGFVGGEGATVTQTAGTYDSKNVGTSKMVTASLVSGDFTANSGTLLSNYVLPTTATGAIGSITVAPLTVSGLTGANRVYDGTTTAGLTGTASISVGGDAVTLNGTGTGTFADKNVANSKAITVTGFSVTGGDATNYSFTQPSGLSANVTPATLAVTGANTSKVYGDVDPVLTFSASGVQSGDTLGAVLTGALNRSAGENVAGNPYAITAGSLATNSNYVMAYISATFTILARPISIVADRLSRMVGMPDPKLTYQVSGPGLLEGDNLTGSLARAPGEGAGSYTIDQGDLGNRNYQITFTVGVLTISPNSSAALVGSQLSRSQTIDDSVVESASAEPEDELLAIVPAIGSDEIEALDGQSCAVAQSGVCLQAAPKVLTR